MDIAKYIGLFLLKNHFCYVHGLGNMELRKLPATFDSKALQAPSYEVIVTPGGSIDDNLANFIAVNEQISISKAANALRDYSIQARKDLAAGIEVPITNIGKFAEQNGKILFITDQNFHFTPAGIPTIRNSKQLDEQNAKLAQKPSYPEPQKADSINWSMVILVIVLIIIIGGGAYGVYYYLNHNKVTYSLSRPADTMQAKAKPAAPPVVDTSHAIKDTTPIIKDSTTTSVKTDSLATISYKMVVGNYPTRLRANVRMKNLALIGNHVDLYVQDTTNFMVYLFVNCKPSDTTHVEDSLSRLFGFKGVAIIK